MVYGCLSPKDYIADPYFLAGLWFEFLGNAVETGVLFFVGFSISFESLPVVEALFEHGECDDEHQRPDVSDQEPDLELWDELGDAEYQEVQVEEELELVDQYDRNESPHVVLHVVDVILLR
jgi:hypothetical protein